MLTPVPRKPMCATYIKTSSYLEAIPSFIPGDSFFGGRITYSHIPPFTLYNIYSSGGRNLALESLTKILIPEPSCIMIGDFNCHHAWWSDDSRLTKHGEKPCQSSPNANTTVDWLEKYDFQLRNKPGIPTTHYPFRSSERRQTVIDLCFSRGDIFRSFGTWLIRDESKSEHSIIGFTLYRPA
jgi:hypothetical protein